jgi:hypothetical protein
MLKSLLRVHHKFLCLHKESKGILKHDNEITTRKQITRKEGKACSCFVHLTNSLRRFNVMAHKLPNFANLVILNPKPKLNHLHYKFT